MAENALEQIRFVPDVSRLNQELDEQLLRDFRVYRVGRLSMSAEDAARGQILYDKAQAALAQVRSLPVLEPSLVTAPQGQLVAAV